MPDHVGPFWHEFVLNVELSLVHFNAHFLLCSWQTQGEKNGSLDVSKHVRREFRDTKGLY